MHLARRKVLESLGHHWTGLTVFVEHPEVPMDNNTAERSERGPVVGRKNYYGSGAEWSGRLAAMTFTLFQTLRLWGLNPRLWLTAYWRRAPKPAAARSRTWTGSCLGTSARSKNGRGDVRRKFRRRIRRSPSGESCPEELKSQDLWPAREVVWERVRTER